MQRKVLISKVEWLAIKKVMMQYQTTMNQLDKLFHIEDIKEVNDLIDWHMKQIDFRFIKTPLDVDLEDEDEKFDGDPADRGDE